MKLGEIQKLIYTRKVEFGIYLKDSEDGQEVLLPGKQVPPNAKIGDEIQVFLYKDSSDRNIATTKTPLITLGQVKRLRVIQEAKIGAFLDWGLEKDLLLPFREQTYHVKAGDEILVALYVDKTGRLCATMKLYPYLSKEHPYAKDDRVEGYVYELSKNFGAFVAVDDMYSALIPQKECVGNIKVAQKINARVVGIKEDGKIDLAVREKAYEMINSDSDKLIELMEENGGSFSFTDKADPEIIRTTTGMSKNEFKRAIGHLLKIRRVKIEKDGIFLLP